MSGLKLIDFVAKNDDVQLEDFSPRAQERINGALGNLTDTEGGPGPGGAGNLIVSKERATEDNDLFESIQAAINDEDTRRGDTIFVEAGSYNGFDVNKADLTLIGPNAGIAGDSDERGPEATIEGRIDISADGVLARGLNISPSGKFTEKTAAGILVNGSNSTVENNIIEGIRGDGSVSIQGIQIFKQTPDRIRNITVSNNLIRDIDNDGGEEWPNYGGAVGVKIQNQLKNITVTGNTVENVHSAGWTYGIVSTPSSRDTVQPEEVLIEKNTIDAVGNGTIYDIFGEGAPYPGTAIGLDTSGGDPEANPTADAGEVTVTENNLLDIPVGVVNKDESSNLTATSNWWGDEDGPGGDGPGDGAAVSSNVDFDPWLDGPFPDGEQTSGS